jgi:cell wall-associated NlpC family hydrolase
MSDPRRAAVVAEAQEWIGTPFHHHARVKGAGVDCLHLLAEVYERCGLIGHVEPGYYPADIMLHQGDERFFQGLLGYGREIEGPPEPGDVALFKYGRIFSHGTIVVAWPRVIHANFAAGAVCWGDANLAPLADRPVRFFTVFSDEG